MNKEKKVRTNQELIKIKMCKHIKFNKHENNREYGWNNCCVCNICFVGCGELYNSPEIGYFNQEELLKIFNKGS